MKRDKIKLRRQEHTKKSQACYNDKIKFVKQPAYDGFHHSKVIDIKKSIQVGQNFACISWESSKNTICEDTA